MAAAVITAVTCRIRGQRATTQMPTPEMIRPVTTTNAASGGNAAASRRNGGFVSTRTTSAAATTKMVASTSQSVIESWRVLPLFLSPRMHARSGMPREAPAGHGSYIVVTLARESGYDYPRGQDEAPTAS